MRSKIRLITALGLAAVALATPGVTSGDDEQGKWEDGDYAYDRARRALGRGEVLPMAQLQRMIVERFPGEVLDVKFEREDGQWVYEFKILTPTGKLLEVYVDAKNGQIISVEDD